MPTLTVTDLRRSLGESTVFSNISFSLNRGEILFVRGPSGVGKSLLLRSIAYLDQFQGGDLYLDSRSPLQLGVPVWRSRVTYVHQTRVPLKGSPLDLFETAKALSSRQKRSPAGAPLLTSASPDLPGLFSRLGLDPDHHPRQPWVHLSGGEAQRAYLAVCLALQPEVLLLDEPTAACDPASTARVEEVLKSSGCVLVWVTHDAQQPGRVGGRSLALPEGLLGNV